MQEQLTDGNSFPPRPSSDLAVTPTAEEIARFREQGFLVVDRITTDAEIEWMTEVYERLFDPDRMNGEVLAVDRSGVQVPEAKGKLTQLFHPEIHFPALLDTVYVRNAKRYAAALLEVDPEELTVWTHMIRKAPGAREVPPHQDIAFWPPDYDYRNVNVWLPLHDVDVEMGTMQFVPGSHTADCLPHRHYDHPSQNLLRVDESVELADPIACPLRRGGCTFHDPATVHQTAVNTTDRTRLAYPLTVQTVPRRRPTSRDTPWLDEFAAAIGDRRQTTYVADGKVLPLPS